MLVQVRVIPKSGREEVLEEDRQLKVFVKAAPEGGKANLKAIKLLAPRFGVPTSFVRLVSGAKSRQKTFKITDYSFINIILIRIIPRCEDGHEPIEYKRVSPEGEFARLHWPLQGGSANG